MQALAVLTYLKAVADACPLGLSQAHRLTSIGLIGLTSVGLIGLTIVGLTSVGLTIVGLTSIGLTIIGLTNIGLTIVSLIHYRIDQYRIEVSD